MLLRMGERRLSSSSSSSSCDVDTISTSRCLAASFRRRSSFHSCDDFGSPGTCNSFFYYRLPKHFLRLSVLKLDGSSFDLQVGRSASVFELKLAVEEIFNDSLKAGEGEISWSHVWGHFCLCYEDQKLLDDKASLRCIGIKDGDQLHFVRHLSVNYNELRRHPPTRESEFEEDSITSTDSRIYRDYLESEKDNRNGSEEDDDDDNFLEHADFKVAHFLKGWLSYTRLWRSEGRVRLSRVNSNCQRNGTREE